jgi:hypothetical protein
LSAPLPIFFDQIVSIVVFGLYEVLNIPVSSGVFPENFPETKSFNEALSLNLETVPQEMSDKETKKTPQHLAKFDVTA